MKLIIALFSITGVALIVFYSALRAQDTPSRSVWDGVYTEAQAKQGQALYSEHCSACHGDTLNGGETAPPLAGGEFLANWNGLTAGDLFERIRTTMPASNPQSLNRETNASILAYIFSANRFPAASAELPGRTEILRGIRVESQKPAK